MGYLETSEYLLSGGGEGGDGRVLGESHGFQWKRRGGRVNRRQQNMMMGEGGDYRD